MLSLINKIQKNENYIYRTIKEFNDLELPKLSEYCYRSNTKSLIENLQQRINITKDDLTEYKLKHFNDYKFAQLLKDTRLIFMIQVLDYQGSVNNKKLINEVVLNIQIRFHSNYFTKMIKYCDPTIQNVQQSNLYALHQYVKEKSPVNFVNRVANEIQKKYEKDIINFNNDQIFKMIYELRTRIAQPIKKFQESYYKTKETTNIISVDTDTLDYNMGNVIKRNFNKMIDDVIKNIQLNDINKNAVKIQNAYTLISYNIIIDTIKEVYSYIKKDNDILYKIYNQMLEQNNNDFDQFFNMDKSLDNIRKQLSIKYTTKKDYLKLTISQLIDKQIMNGNNLMLRKKYASFSSNSIHKLRLQIAYYLYCYLYDMTIQK